MKRSIIFLITFFLIILILNSSQAIGNDNDEENHGKDDEKNGEDEREEAFGDLARWLLIFTSSIVVWKPIIKWLKRKGPKLLDIDPEIFRKQFNRVNYWLMQGHFWFGGATLIVAIIHGMTTKCNLFVLLGLGGIGLMCITGLLMVWRKSPRIVKKGARLIHATRFLLVVIIILLLIGHLIIE